MKAFPKSNSNRISTTQQSFLWKQEGLLALILALSLLALPSGLRAQTTFCDNFNDGDDTLPLPPWTHYDPLVTFGGGGTWSFPNGNSYRLQAPASPDPVNLCQARIGGGLCATFNHMHL